MSFNSFLKPSCAYLFFSLKKGVTHSTQFFETFDLQVIIKVMEIE